MFDNLLESKVRRQRSVGQAAVSLLLHGALIFGAVKATHGVAETIREIPIDTSMVFIPKAAEPTPPSAPASPPPSDLAVSVDPPPKGFKTVAPPIEIPQEIPPIDLNQKPFDPKDFTGAGVEGGSALGVIGGTGSIEGGGVGVGGGGGNGGPYLAGDLDDPVAQISIPEPRYPPALQSAMISGTVELQYIVDTTGHAEPNSFKVLQKSHDAFVNPAKEAILKGVFKPARFRGKPVRQLVQQKISFKAGQ